MLEMFILNPPGKAGRTRDAPSRRAKKRGTRFLKKVKWFKVNRRKKMANRTKRRVSRRRFRRNFIDWMTVGAPPPWGSGPEPKKKKKSGRKKKMGRARVRARVKHRRRSRGKGWWNDKRGHKTAGKIGAAQSPRRKRGGRARYFLKKFGLRKIVRHRAKHRKSRKRAHSPLKFLIRVGGRKKRYRLIANRRKSMRYADNAKRGRRLPPRGRGGRFKSKSRRGGSYKRNWFVYNNNPKRRRSRRRKYSANWFVYNDNAKKRRRKGKSRRRYSANSRTRRYMDNDVMADALSTVKGVFDFTFLTNIALPVVGGFFGSRVLSGAVGGALLGANYTGAVRHLGNLVSSGLAGVLVGFLTKNATMAGNVVLGGVVNALAGLIRDVVKDVAFVQESPMLKETFGLAGMGLGAHDDVRSAVEREVMRELGVSDFLTSEQLSRAERVGDFLTSEQLSRAERVGQYPQETSGPAYLAQYPEETSGGAMADFADVASFGA
jgi:hypothetical protein